jgi:hypothetical protein
LGFIVFPGLVYKTGSFWENGDAMRIRKQLVTMY